MIINYEEVAKKIAEQLSNIIESPALYMNNDKFLKLYNKHQKLYSWYEQEYLKGSAKCEM